jgi:predicted alpha/beta superfamily hydrolase
MNRKILCCSAASLLFLLNLLFVAKAQNNTGKTDSVFSRVLNEQRTFQVFLPAGYDTKAKYDVLYVLDGEAYGENASEILSIDQDLEYAPPMIVVSIWNREIDIKHASSRIRDFLPAEAEGYLYSGGSDKFLDFLKSELIPLIDQKYPSSRKNVLFGHSYGGLFAIYALFARPGLFQSYIASDPSLWWNDGYVNKFAVKNMANITKSDKTLYFAGRAGNLSKVLGSHGLDSILKAQAPAGFKWKSAVYENERHQTVRIKTLYDGLKFTYFGYNPTPSSSYKASALSFYPMNGILLNNKPIKLMTATTYLDYEPGIRYTTDGSDPTVSSPKFEFGTLISSPADVTLKLFATQSANLIAQGHFSLGTAMAAKPLPKKSLPGGFVYSYYKGNWMDIPNFDQLVPSKMGLAKDYISGLIADTSNFACKIDGYLEVDNEGYYTFFLQADNRAKLSIGSLQMLDIQVKKDGLNNKSFVVPLEKGLYPLNIKYLHRSGDALLRLTYIPPPNDEYFLPPLAIPFKLQFHEVTHSKKTKD